MKKILFVTHAASYGGAELFLRDVVLHARSSGQEWPVIFLADGPLKTDLIDAGATAKTVSAGAQILKLKRGSNVREALSALYSIYAVVKVLAKEFRNYDVICANSQKSLFIAGLAARLARKPFVWILHDLVSDQSFSGAMRRALVFFANHMTSAVVANSYAAKDALVQCGGKADKISVVYNGFDFDTNFGDNATERDRATLLGEAGLSDLPTVGLFGRIAQWKGQHVLIEAVERVPRLQAIIVGDATYQDGSYFDQIRAMVEDRNLSHRVKFLGFRKDVQRLMATVDIVAHTSTEPEPFGRVIVEGMAQRRPVIATRGGGVGEIIDHPTNGILCEAGDSVALAEAMRAIITDDAMASRLAEAGYQKVTARFSIERSVRDLKDVFDGLSRA
ncbi:glycosyltransferase family 4 protein [Methylobacterium sp. J-026]|uniref:glycosyltransferase family 4 protein n=1 Tax=Methylobacterium sp. J-026 TaxID=2836624 RepID=UPI001FBBDFB1|nr:glycosyltransferase family 4 protein [Methylobacterium sp. J-026]MCJ2133756.1 glycosyltransferase family 4 protein [Methylobacterium sp. J-026]